MLRHGCAFFHLLVILRLIQTKIARQYRILVAFNAFALIRYVVMSSLTDKRSIAFFWAWSIGDLISMLLLGAVIWEIFTLTEARYNSVGNYCKKALLVFAVISLGIGYRVTTAGQTWTNPVFAASFLHAWLTFAYALVMFLISAFFGLVHSQVPENLKIHRWLITIYCLIQTASYTYLNVFLQPSVPWVQLVVMLSSTCIWFAYALLIQPFGEFVEAPPTPEEAEAANIRHDQLMAELRRVAAQRLR